MASPSSRPCANFYGSHIRPFLKPLVGISSWVSEVALLSSNEDLGIKSPPWASCPRWAVTLSLRTLMLCDPQMWSVWSRWWAVRTHVVNLLPLPLGTRLPLQPLLQPTSAVSFNLPQSWLDTESFRVNTWSFVFPNRPEALHSPVAVIHHSLCNTMHSACSRQGLGAGVGAGGGMWIHSDTMTGWSSVFELAGIWAILLRSPWQERFSPTEPCESLQSHTWCQPRRQMGLQPRPGQSQQPHLHLSSVAG